MSSASEPYVTSRSWTEEQRDEVFGLFFWSSLLSNEKKCCCICFEPKAERLAELRGRRPESARAAGASRDGSEDLNGKASAAAEGEPFKPQTVLLRWKASAGRTDSGARQTLVVPSFSRLRRGYGGQAVLGVVLESGWDERDRV